MNARDRDTSEPKDPDNPNFHPAVAKRASEGEAPSRAPNLERWIQKVRQLPAVREDLVQRIKAEINAGKYETPEKLDVASQRLLEELDDG